MNTTGFYAIAGAFFVFFGLIALLVINDYLAERNSWRNVAANSGLRYRRRDRSFGRDYRDTIPFLARGMFRSAKHVLEGQIGDVHVAIGQYSFSELAIPAQIRDVKGSVILLSNPQLSLPCWSAWPRDSLLDGPARLAGRSALFFVDDANFSRSFVVSTSDEQAAVQLVLSPRIRAVFMQFLATLPRTCETRRNFHVEAAGHVVLVSAGRPIGPLETVELVNLALAALSIWVEESA